MILVKAILASLTPAENPSLTKFFHDAHKNAWDNYKGRSLDTLASHYEETCWYAALIKISFYNAGG